MFIWCAYCGKYIGEKEPFDNFAVSHGACDGCFKEIKSVGDQDLIQKFEPIRNFYSDIRKAIINKDYAKIQQSMDDISNLSINEQDLVFGIFQPLLYEVGKMWESGLINVSQEHVFSNIVQSVLERIFRSYPEYNQYRNPINPDVVLTCVAGNYHTIGIRMLEMFLVFKKISVSSFLPCLPNPELVDLVNSLKPKILGLSISIPFHLSEVVKLENLAKDNPSAFNGTKVFIGGFPIRNGLKLPPDSSFQASYDFNVFYEEAR